MGRPTANWSKHYPRIWDDEKTAVVAARLVDAGVPAEYAKHVAVCAVLRLAAWALGDGETGETTTLSDARLASIAWPEAVESKRAGLAIPARAGATLRQALRSAGFLDVEGSTEWIHNFTALYLEVINKRLKGRGIEPITPEFLQRNGSGFASVSPPILRGCINPSVAKRSVAKRSVSPLPPAPGSAIPPEAAPEPAPATPPAEPPPTPPASAPTTDLAARLAARIGAKPATCAEVLDELRGEGHPEPWLTERVEGTPSARMAPWAWAKATRKARPAAAAAERERVEYRRSAHAWADRAREASDLEAARGAWSQALGFAQQAGLPVAELGDPPDLEHTRTASAALRLRTRGPGTCFPPEVLVERERRAREGVESEA